jgi:hypothetical protein
MHEREGPQSVAHVPFRFFEDLHEEHRRLLNILCQKIDETESLAKAIFSK